jgi:hypothetical protein
MFSGMKIQIWSYLYKNVTNPEMEILRDFPCTLKAGIFSLKKIFSPFIKKRI